MKITGDDLFMSYATAIPRCQLKEIEERRDGEIKRRKEIEQLRRERINEF
jgi:hypothetical protein